VVAALNLPSTSSLFANEMREKRRIAAEEKRREVVLKLAKSEQLKAERMSLVLNTAPQVQKKRKKFALQVLLRQALYFVCVLAAFIMTTPAAPDFYSAQMARYRSIVIDRFKETYDVSCLRAGDRVRYRMGAMCVGCGMCQMRTREDWWVWFDKHILWYDVNNGENRHRVLAPDVFDAVDPGSECVMGGCVFGCGVFSTWNRFCLFVCVTCELRRNPAECSCSSSVRVV
jgi:hypothetical protein